ncbi:excalibur calcium-binding domain-containing protein [Paenibacillus sp. WLX1005]
MCSGRGTRRICIYKNCSAVRAAGKALLYEGEPRYKYKVGSGWSSV